MKSAKGIFVPLLALSTVGMACGAGFGHNGELSPAVRAGADSTPARFSEGWEKALGKWQKADGSLVFELVDLNRADREYHPDEPIKVEGYVRKVPPNWPAKIRAGDLIFISNKIEGDTLFGKWIQLAQKGDCPKLAYDFSPCSLKIGAAGGRLTLEVESKQYRYPQCEWTDKFKVETFIYSRVK